MLPHVSVVALVADSTRACARPEHCGAHAGITREDCAAAARSLDLLWNNDTAAKESASSVVIQNVEI